MIAQIQGRLIEKTPTEVIIDCHGVGYQINISLYTYSLIGADENLKLYTFLQIKDDAHTLFGFIDKVERELFKLLISVSGVGGNTARNILSSTVPKELLQMIANADAKSIQRIKGIGAKTAQRIILDLQEKVLKLYNIDEVLPTINNTNADEALSALEVLGFVRKTAEKVVDVILKANPEASVEDIIKQALKKL
ncbi:MULTISPECIES: Holliday junction branch migration protein RuvA [Myroides]|jgi:Holliday junction DNA helicase RuvA|uniref:Holliday junction branch migration complex subunit RuvA n=1 Tax=Myroides odoratus TaxID=256 RepID=A0A378RXH6_MYROD|nr:MULTISPECIES: Holliday junction branch migration protein RuvA [Myroides]MDH6601738.1 Holliday junction DNA helicase RuvA [Myroides gitamensis]EHQ43100.1 Holliday junction DNA helicase subunit RuvA [Myroides odoratus DSM 2801]EKB06481.1 Holliday junction DNA helicase RuvA [Myroides odoratus CIP 103059]MCS4237522.1 Holliday junction DNA helicase RuvA [Myroides odoratus]MDR0224004.1 Holliday junction branch migration protein RuvA [Myroides odoratus]